MDAITPKRRLQFEQDVGLTNSCIDDESRDSIHSEQSTMVPKVDMEFETEDEAYEMYNAYAFKVGFSIRKGRVHKDNGKLLDRTFVCSCEGKRVPDKRDDDYKSHRPETRYGCLAMLKISCRQSSKFRVVNFIQEHNHNLASPNKAHLCRSHRRMSASQASEVDMAEKSGIAPKRVFEYMANQAGGRECLGFVHEDLKNYLRTKRSVQMKSGETGGVLEYLKGMQIKDPCFFYALQVDKDELITNIFWADAKMRADYDDFGDAVSFDTTYRKHKDARPIALFVGVNHHKQTIIFGAALLFDETADSFVWLFDTFSRAMSGKLPKTIITDQDAAMSKALAFQWPESYHRLCIWHIFQNAAIHLSSVFGKFTDFATDFKNCVYDHDYEEDFLDAWSTMLQKYDLQENEWLKRLFDIKEKWALVYGRDTFCADMLSTQRSESMNNVLKGYISYKHNLRAFFDNFERLVNDRRYDELVADFKASQSKISLAYPAEILKHAASMYTPKVFKLFQAESCKCYDCRIVSCEEVGASTMYFVRPHGMQHNYVVSYDTSEEEVVSCSCRKFEFAGIVCCHILKVFTERGIIKIPDKYILKRWTKNAKKGSREVISEGSAGVNPEGVIGRRYRDLCRISTRLATRAADFEETYNMVINGLMNLLKELDMSCTGKPLECKSGSSQVIGTQEEELQDPVSINDIVKTAKGIKIKPKVGNQSSKRPKGALDKATRSKPKKKKALPNSDVSNSKPSSSQASMIHQDQFQVPMESQPEFIQTSSNTSVQASSMNILTQQSSLLPLLQQFDDFDAYAKLLQTSEL